VKGQGAAVPPPRPPTGYVHHLAHARTRGITGPNLTRPNLTWCTPPNLTRAGASLGRISPGLVPSGAASPAAGPFPHILLGRVPPGRWANFC
jgi:hypothetical protein